MIPPADRILMDRGHKARKNLADNADLGFLVVGPALCIMQLNIKGLSAAKRHILQPLAEIHHIDVICLEETHVNDDKSDHLTIITHTRRRRSANTDEDTGRQSSSNESGTDTADRDERP